MIARAALGALRTLERPRPPFRPHGREGGFLHSGFVALRSGTLGFFGCQVAAS